MPPGALGVEASIDREELSQTWTKAWAKTRQSWLFDRPAVGETGQPAAGTGEGGEKGHGCVRCSCVRSWLDSETASHFPIYALCNLKECIFSEIVLLEPSDRQECDKYHNIWNQKILGSGVGKRECRGCGNFLVIWNVLSDRKCPKLPPQSNSSQSRLLLSNSCNLHTTAYKAVWV